MSFSDYEDAVRSIGSSRLKAPCLVARDIKVYKGGTISEIKYVKTFREAFMLKEPSGKPLGSFDVLFIV